MCIWLIFFVFVVVRVCVCVLELVLRVLRNGSLLN